MEELVLNGGRDHMNYKTLYNLILLVYHYLTIQ